MERFAVISVVDKGERIIKSHSLLRRLPDKYARLCLKYIPARKTGLIVDNEESLELGYIIDVPGFLLDWNKLTRAKRLKHILGIEKVLKELGVKHLCFPTLYQYLTEEEVLYLEGRGILVLDCYIQRLAGLILTLKQLGFIMRRDMPFIEVGIWGADTDTGRAFVEAMATRVNNMCIGGSNRRTLGILADQLLKSTGLSCRVTTDVRTCLNSKHVAVLAQPVETRYNLVRPSFHINAYREHRGPGLMTSTDAGIYTIDMGWVESPRNLSIDFRLEPWEGLGVLEGLLYNVSRVYREDIINKRISYDQLTRVAALYGLYPLRVQGLVQDGIGVHFDRVRMEYFRYRKRWLNNKSTSSNNTP
ncbi:MAG TPA: hypothetical protein VFD33_04640 [Bacillota bacterium]|nr:hypothetical protein [Bacillota bacterium]